MSSNKLITIFLICVVFGAALSAEKAAAGIDESFSSCINSCIEECKGESSGYTLCEMKCDSECSEKELLDKLRTRFN